MGVLMTISCTMFGLRSAFTVTFLEAYQDNINRGVGVNDVLQMTQLTYDFTMLLRQQLHTGKVLYPE